MFSGGRLKLLLKALLVVFLAGLFIEFLPFEAALLLVTAGLSHLGLIRKTAFSNWMLVLRSRAREALDVLRSAMPRKQVEPATPDDKQATQGLEKRSAGEPAHECHPRHS
jgi:hypothetical protein